MARFIRVDGISVMKIRGKYIAAGKLHGLVQGEKIPFLTSIRITELDKKLRG